MELKRVVVTGMGAVTPLGNTTEETWKNLIEGVSGAGPITHFDASLFKTQFACEVKDFNVGNYIDRKEARRMDLYTQYALAAAKMAVDDSGMDLEAVNKDRIGVVIGVGIGGIHTFEEEAGAYALTGKELGPKYNPFFIPKMIADIAAGQISMIYGFRGPNFGIVSACASSTHALIDAYNYIRLGKADFIVSGGAEAAITVSGVGGFNAMHALSTRNDSPETASRPFSASRDGFVMGEGSACLILEELEHAKKRGAHIYAEVIGYGYNSDAYHITAPDPSGEMPAECMLAAISDGGITPDDGSYVNAHGTSTHRNDLNETLACKKIFGDRAKQVPISSNKSMTGHLLGAAGGMEAVASVLTIETGIFPPTIYYEDPDTEDEMDLDYVPNVARKADVDVVLSNNFGFGGHNACVAFRKYKD